MRGRAWTSELIETALGLSRDGLSDYAVSRRTGIPRATVQHWRKGGLPATRTASPASACPRCGNQEHRFLDLPGPAYAYLLGQYLGDGTIYRSGRRGFALSIASDAQYSGIISECCAAIEAIKGRHPYVRYHSEKRLASIVSYWKSWPCVFPQHGPGRKHTRAIVLVEWQVEIVDAHPGRFLRGLIHSDGWRGLNRVCVKGRRYAYPRYQFSNRSADIKRLFSQSCERLGVEWRPWGPHHISVARHASVAILDRHVGPKR